MVSGIVRPPAIDLANRDLIEAHLHTVWLAESAQELQPPRHPACSRSERCSQCYQSLALAGKKRLGIDTGWNHGLEGQSASRTQSVRNVGKVANQTWMGIVSDQEPTAITGKVLFALGIG